MALYTTTLLNSAIWYNNINDPNKNKSYDDVLDDGWNYMCDKLNFNFFEDDTEFQEFIKSQFFDKYLDNEIAYDTPTLFKRKFTRAWNSIFPYYGNLWKILNNQIDILSPVKTLSETHEFENVDDKKHTDFYEKTKQDTSYENTGKSQTDGFEENRQDNEIHNTTESHTTENNVRDDETHNTNTRDLTDKNTKTDNTQNTLTHGEKVAQIGGKTTTFYDTPETNLVVQGNVPIEDYKTTITKEDLPTQTHSGDDVTKNTGTTIDDRLQGGTSKDDGTLNRAENNESDTVSQAESNNSTVAKNKDSRYNTLENSGKDNLENFRNNNEEQNKETARKLSNYLNYSGNINYPHGVLINSFINEAFKITELFLNDNVFKSLFMQIR